jgi:hypothetical protein
LLFEVPVAGIDDEDLIDTYALLLASGMPIGEMNCVRRALSALKGGGSPAPPPPLRSLPWRYRTPGDVPPTSARDRRSADDPPDRALASGELRARRRARNGGGYCEREPNVPRQGERSFRQRRRGPAAPIASHRLRSMSSSRPARPRMRPKIGSKSSATP